MNPVDLRVNELHATAHLDGDVLRLALAGTADATTESALGGLLPRLHAAAVQASLREARIDLRQLEFMNSSCFKAFITWIVTVGKLEPSHRYHLRFLCNPAVYWQNRSLRAMTHFGGDIISVENG